MSEQDPSISTETALRVLTKPRRRRILRRVAAADGGTSVDRLAQQLGAPEVETDTRRTSEDAVPVELHHAHLPMLGEAGVVEFDAESGTVRRGEHFRTVYSLLTALEGDEEPSK